MGSCVSIREKSGSALKLQMSTPSGGTDKHSIPPTPTKEKPAIVDPPIVSVGYKSHISSLKSVATYRSYGSKEEAFYDTQAWLESDCDDDFYSVNGDFTPSCSSTPIQSVVGTPRLSRVFSPRVNRALFESRPSLHSASNKSRGGTPVHRRSFSATTPKVNGTTSEVVAGSKSDSSLPPKKKKLADLFRESFRERNKEGLTLAENEDGANGKREANAYVIALPPKAPHVSSTSSLSRSGKTNTDGHTAPKKEIKSPPQCCFPKLVSVRCFHKKASTPLAVDDL